MLSSKTTKEFIKYMCSLQNDVRKENDRSYILQSTFVC